MKIGFGNNTVSSLAADITASQTTIQVMPGAGAMFARLLTYDYANSSNTLQTYAKITLTDAKETVFEICHLTAVNDDVLTVVRAQEGTSAKGWSLNDVVANFATRGSENQFVQIEDLQSGHYTSGVAGGTANALTLALPATYFVNGSTDWTLRTPLVVYPAQNNTGASTLQLTMGGKVLGTFPLYKGNKAQLSANDILKDVALVCLMDKTKAFFSVANPGAIYAGLGTAAFKDIVTSMTDETAGRIPVVGWEGLGGVSVPMPNADILATGVLGTRFFKQGNGSGENHFGGYGVGVHMIYGANGGNTQRLTGNLFIDSAGDLSVEWLAVNIADGTIATQILRKWISTTGGTIVGNSAPLVIENKTQDQALYFLALNADGTNKWFIGNGANDNDTAAFHNYLGGNNITLSEDGAVSISGKTRLTTNMEVVSTSANGFRIAYGNYGSFWRGDSTTLYLMLTNSGDPYGTYNSLRPFAVNLATGDININKLTLINYSAFDARYGVVNTIRRGGKQHKVGGDWIGDWEAPAGCYMTGLNTDEGGDGRKMGIYYRQQQYFNKQTNSWVNMGD